MALVMFREQTFPEPSRLDLLDFNHEAVASFGDGDDTFYYQSTTRSIHIVPPESGTTKVFLVDAEISLKTREIGNIYYRDTDSIHLSLLGMVEDGSRVKTNIIAETWMWPGYYGFQGVTINANFVSATMSKLGTSGVLRVEHGGAVTLAAGVECFTREKKKKNYLVKEVFQGSMTMIQQRDF